MNTYLASLVQLCCGEGGTIQTNTAGLCGECSRWMYHTGFASTQGSMYFMGPHCAGSSRLCKGTVPSEPCIACTSHVYVLRVSDAPQGTDPDGLCGFYLYWVQATKVTRCLVSSVFQVGRASYAPPQSLPPFSQVCCKGTVPSVVIYLLCEGDLRL